MTVATSPSSSESPWKRRFPICGQGASILCEDIHGQGNAFAAYAHGLAGQLNAASWTKSLNGSTASQPTPFQAAIKSVHCYPFVVVIERADFPVEQFVAPKHGTQWQLFL